MSTTYFQRMAAMRPWLDQAVCNQVDPDLFFPGRGDTLATRRAKAICATCPVINQCLAYALEHNERYGIWGGLSESERRHRRKTAAA